MALAIAIADLASGGRPDPPAAAQVLERVDHDEELQVLAHGARGADDRRLLADRQVEEPARFGPLVLAPGLLLEAADQQHVAQRGQFLFPGEFQRFVRAVGFFLARFFSDAFLGCGHGNSG